MSKKIVGIGVTTAGLAGDMPQLNRVGGPIIREKRLFFSRRDQALIIQKNVVGGFGELEMGQVMVGVVGVSNRVLPIGFEVPLTVNVKNGGSAIEFNSKYKPLFKVGDKITLADHASSATPPEHFTVATIVAGAAPGDTKITFAGSEAVAGGTSTNDLFTTANEAYVMFTVSNGSTVNAPCYILDQYTDTGEDFKDIGAHTSVVVSNAVLYTDGLVGAYSTVLTALGAKVDGPYLIMK